MAKRKSILILPVLKDGGGFLSKRWYVEYSYRDPRTDQLKRFRHYITGETAEERYSTAENIIDELRTKLMNGWSPFSIPKIVYEDEIIYANAAKTYGKLKEEVVSIKSHLSQFLAYKKAEVNTKSYVTYRSKLRNFYMYLEKENLTEVDISKITNKIIIEFMMFQAERNDLSVLTMKKYSQILYSFFAYLYEARLIAQNPVYNIPRLGKVVDKAPSAIPDEARKELSEIIKSEDPQLHLACIFIYYTAIRPGQELRLLKIKHININSRTVTIPATTSKKDRHETVDLPMQLVNTLKQYNLKLYNQEFYLFGKYGRPGDTPLGINTLSNRFNKIRDKYGYSSDYKFYSWKHTGAQALKDANVSPYVIQRHLRHKSFETTERYLRKRLGQNNKKIIEEFPDID